VAELGLALTRLAIAGLLAIALSGIVAGIFGSAFGRSFVAGDPPGITYPPARCADFFGYSPGAATCEEAATWHHYGEVVRYRLMAGVLGVLLFAGYRLARRRLPAGTGALPAGFEATLGTAMYGAVGAYLLFASLSDAVIHRTAGMGATLSAGVISAAMALAYGIALYRVLLGR
jgi:hypothetical protein